MEQYGEKNALVEDAILSYISLLDSSPLQTDELGYKPAKIFRHFAKELCADLKSVVLRYSELFDMIVESTTLYGSGSITGEFIDGMKDTPIFHEYLTFHRTGNPHLLTFIASFLVFLKKMDYDDETFHATAFRGWLKNEEKLRTLSLPDTIGLKTVVHTLLRGWEFSRPYGRYGPGHVSERYMGSIEKSIHFSVDPVLRKAFLEPNFFSGFEEPLVCPVSLPRQKSDVRPSALRFARIKFVPKNLKTSRSICIEPNAKMFFQQMVSRSLEDHFSTKLFEYVDLQDQLRNREAAALGSVTGDLDTIDLSSASDLISYDLVKRIMPRKLLFLMQATRTSRVKTSKGVLELQKYAPMGSALCFPTQCLIFLSVCILASVNVKKGSNDLFAPVSPDEVLHEMELFVDYKGKYVPWRDYYRPLVYGDDIVVDSKLTPHVTQMLEALGLEVNNSKSYKASCAFRESCGGFYWNGFDITPCQFRVRANWRGTVVSRHMSMVEHCNKLLEYGYFRSRKHFLLVLRESSPYPVLFSNLDISGAVKVLGVPYNAHLSSRFNKDLQRAEVKSVGARAIYSHDTKAERKRTKSMAHERYGYMRWWDTASRREVDSQPRGKGFARFDSFDSRPVWRWTPYR